MEKLLVSQIKKELPELEIETNSSPKSNKRTQTLIDNIKELIPDFEIDDYTSLSRYPQRGIGSTQQIQVFLTIDERVRYYSTNGDEGILRDLKLNATNEYHMKRIPSHIINRDFYKNIPPNFEKCFCTEPLPKNNALIISKFQINGFRNMISVGRDCVDKFKIKKSCNYCNDIVDEDTKIMQNACEKCRVYIRDTKKRKDLLQIDILNTLTPREKKFVKMVKYYEFTRKQKLLKVRYLFNKWINKLCIYNPAHFQHFNFAHFKDLQDDIKYFYQVLEHPKLIEYILSEKYQKEYKYPSYRLVDYVEKYKKIRGYILNIQIILNEYDYVLPDKIQQMFFQ